MLGDYAVAQSKSVAVAEGERPADHIVNGELHGQLVRVRADNSVAHSKPAHKAAENNMATDGGQLDGGIREVLADEREAFVEQAQNKSRLKAANESASAGEPQRGPQRRNRWHHGESLALPTPAASFRE